MNIKSNHKPQHQYRHDNIALLRKEGLYVGATGLVWITQCNVYSRRASSLCFVGDDCTYHGFHNQGQSRTTRLFLIDVTLAREDANYKVYDVIAGDYGVPNKTTVH